MIKVSNKEMMEVYSYLNHKYFKSKLPRLEIKFIHLKGFRLGRTYFEILCSCKRCDKLRIKYGPHIKNNHLPRFIEIDKRLSRGKGSPELSYAVLLHEMAHVSVGGKHQHGPKFRKEMKRLLRAGAGDPVFF